MRLYGMRAFTIIWVGQLVSIVGTQMSRFALTIWAWDVTHEATPLALIALFGALPPIIMGLFAGVLVDRWNRKRIIMLSDTAAAAATGVILLAYLTGGLQLWHLYLASLIAGGAGAFQGIAFAAATTTLVGEKQYARASGMMTLAEYLSMILGPFLAGVLIGPLGFGGILIIDIITFFIGVGTLALIPLPGGPVAGEETAQEPILRAASYGFRYIFRDAGLSGLLVMLGAFAFTEALGFPLISPMILARTGGNEALLGTVRAVMGIGGVVGGLIVTAWGGPKRRVHGLLIGFILTGLLGDALMGAGQALPAWLVAAIGIEVFIPLVLACNQAIWQSRVPAQVQGRVFAARRLVGDVAETLAVLVAGLLVDNAFEPAMQPGGALAPVFGGLVGVGPGAGMGLLMAGCGLLIALIGLSGYLLGAVRRVEAALPGQT